MILALTLGLCLSVPDLQSEPWYYADFARLKREGILLGTPYYLNKRHFNPDRSDLATMTVASYDQWLENLGQIDTLRGFVATAKEPSDSVQSVRQYLNEVKDASPVVDSLCRIVVEFAPEIRAQYPQRSPTTMIKRLSRSRFELARLVIPTVGQAQQRFHDVPQNHWADAAIHRLRSEGILWGYSDVSFSNPRTTGKR